MLQEKNTCRANGKPTNLIDPTGFDCIGQECSGYGTEYFNSGFESSTYGNDYSGVFTRAPPSAPSGFSGSAAGGNGAGAPVQAAERQRLVSMPTGPSAPAGAISGPTVKAGTGGGHIYVDAGGGASVDVPPPVPFMSTLGTGVWNMKAIHAGDISPVGIVVSSVRGFYDGVVVPVKDWAIDIHGDGPHRDHSEAMTGALGTVVLMAILPGESAVGEEALVLSLCFAEGTKVLMADRSTKSIEEVHEGDVVLADDPLDAYAAEPRKVTKVHRKATYRFFHVEIGDRDGGDIVATGSHPFWTQRGWVTTKDLTNRDVLTDDVGRAISIRAIAIESRDAPTFNLSIEGSRTFFVVAGKTPVLVHNVDPYDVSFSQSSYGRNFAEGEWAGKSLAEAVAEARTLGRLPNGLTLNVIEVNNQWVALNNRTLAVAQMANLPEVAINDVGPGGINKLLQLLRGSDLLSPVETAVMRCK